MLVFLCFFFSSRRRHTRCALVTGVQTCALPILRRVLGVSTTTTACSRRNNCRLAVIVASSGWESAVLHLHHVGGHLARLVHHPPLDVAGGDRKSTRLNSSH